MKARWVIQALCKERSSALSKRRVQAGDGGPERQLSMRRVNVTHPSEFGWELHKWSDETSAQVILDVQVRDALRHMLGVRAERRQESVFRSQGEGRLRYVIDLGGDNVSPGQHSDQRNVHFNFDVYEWDDDAYLTGHDVVACYLVEIGVTSLLPTIYNQTAHF